MKNLLKILLILAFSAPVFANLPSNPTAITTTAIAAMSPDEQKAWVASLTSDQYNMLNSDVQKWVMENASGDQKKALGINQ